MIDFYGLRFGLQDKIESAYDKTELRHACALLGHDTNRILIAGAGHGGMAAILADYVGVENLFAYEANPELCKRIRSGILVNGSPLQLFEGAIGPEEFEAPFQVDEDWVTSHLSQPNERTVLVHQFDINKEIQRHHIDFLLLDVENAEWDIFPILNFDPLVKISLEVHFQGGDTSSVAPLLESKGYTVHADVDDKPGTRVISATKRELDFRWPSYV